MKLCEAECGDKEVFWLDAGLHPREWIGPAVLSYVTKVRSVSRKWVGRVMCRSW